MISKISSLSDLNTVVKDSKMAKASINTLKYGKNCAFSVNFIKIKLNFSFQQYYAH